MMKLLPAILFVVVLPILAGCGQAEDRSATVAEGVIYSVEYKMENGHAAGFTRLNDSRAVHGGNGSWNVDARGRLTRDFLIITRPQSKDFGPQVIPVQRLMQVQFGDGGIRTVNENQPAPGK